jgi:hypothetical protein
MARYVHIALAAEGQGLEVQAPPVLASAAVDYMVFDVSLSHEWDGFAEYYVMVRNRHVVKGCKIIDGVSSVPAEVVAKAGAVEVSIMARDGDKRLTTESVVLTLKDSNL